MYGIASRNWILGLVLVVGTSGLAVAGENWPQYRGADSRGVVEGGDLPVEWDTEKNIEWKTDIAGRGWSSPIVWGDKVFLTTAINSAPTEKAKMGLYMGGERARPKTSHQWC